MSLPKSADLWLPSYLRNRTRHLLRTRKPKRVWVAFTDHYEPHGGVTVDIAHQRVAAWQERWPSIAAAAPRDAAGNRPCMTFFYPQEEYDYGVLNAIRPIVDTGYADVEVHLHHFDDTAPSFVQKVEEFKKRLHDDHGFLHVHNGRVMFGFIHGNWALDNSRPDGKKCGVKGELQLLRDLGCYADFTMPSLPSPTQSRIVNQIYWTTGDPERPRGFDQGVEATVGGGKQGDLLMITGPTGFRYKSRMMPRLETSELACYDPATPYRVKRWMDLAPTIGDDMFIKLYGHSAREDNATALLGTSSKEGNYAPMFRWIAEEAERRNLELHWVSAYDMFRAAESLIFGGKPL